MIDIHEVAESAVQKLYGTPEAVLSHSLSRKQGMGQEVIKMLGHLGQCAYQEPERLSCSGPGKAQNAAQPIEPNQNCV